MRHPTQSAGTREAKPCPTSSGNPAPSASSRPAWRPSGASSISDTPLRSPTILPSINGASISGQLSGRPSSISSTFVFHDQPDAVLIEGAQMPSAQWFPGATLNFAEHLLRRRDDAVAVVAIGENGQREQLTWAELASHVAGFSKRPESCRCRPRRPRGRVHAEHLANPGGHARDDQPGRDLVLFFTRLRHPWGDRPLRPDRAESADHLRRLPLRRQRHRPDSQG